MLLIGLYCDVKHVNLAFLVHNLIQISYSISSNTSIKQTTIRYLFWLVPCSYIITERTQVVASTMMYNRMTGLPLTLPVAMTRSPGHRFCPYTESLQLMEGIDLHRQVTLTHLPQGNMVVISQTIFSDAFPWMETLVFWSKYHWSLLLRV